MEVHDEGTHVIDLGRTGEIEVKLSGGVGECGWGMERKRERGVSDGWGRGSRRRHE